jgi:nucleotide-binding universal stress UspA family protein
MKLLLAVDDSPPSEAAVDEAAARPWPDGTLIRVLTVAPVTLGTPVPGPPVAGVPLSHEPLVSTGLETQQVLVDAAGAVAERAAERLHSRGLRAESRVREGKPGPEVVDEARDWDADLIMMGTHSRGGLKRIVLGSVANHVLNHAPCSIEVVRRAQHA